MNNQTYYKLVRADWVHFGARLRVGLNTLNEKFEENPLVNGGGFYICKKEDIPQWLSLYTDLQYVCEVQLPPDVRIVQCVGKAKVNKMILANPCYISVFLQRHYAPADIVHLCHDYPAMIRFVFDPIILRVLVSFSPSSIKDMPITYRTLDICQVAIAADPTLLCYVPLDCQTYDLCKSAVQRNEKVLADIIDPIIRNHLGKRANPWWGTKVERERLGLEWDTEPSKSHSP